MQETLIVNARVHTMSPRGTLRGAAVALRDGRVLGVGDELSVRSLLGRSVLRVDAQGGSVIPGFTDCHIHFTAFAQRTEQVTLEGAGGLAEVLERVRAKAADLAPGEWVVGGGYDRNLWPASDRPTAQALDQAVPDRPVALASKDGHQVWVNTLALERAGFLSGLPDPAGGVVERDEAGRPTGVLKERAADRIWQVVQDPDLPTLRRMAARAQQRLHALGVTGIHVPEGPTAFRLFQEMATSGDLALRVCMMLPADRLQAAADLGIEGGFGSSLLRVGPVKIFADGSLGSQTAALLDPYQGREADGYRGVVVTEADELEDLVARATQAGLAAAIHAIGDRANRMALDALEPWLFHSRRRGLRHRIEHAQLVDPRDRPRFGQLGVIASMQPVHGPQDRTLVTRHWGAERAGHAYAWRSLREAGARLAFGSDAPVESPDPLLGLHAAMTRRLPGEAWEPEEDERSRERLTLQEALEAYTLGAAFASGEEAAKGSIEPGKLADVVILSHDLAQLPLEAWEELHVRGTFWDGRVVYRSQDLPVEMDVRVGS
ncbi:amidohydrolase [Limnochorda pilosa]|uniref:Amidohydrolase n=1 Tax=Limnochorda pilosa TaxID=1555112 RepID=A0A0K2SPV7_LIMPI|nr:amidohydrolase [Limnochorda pilosa]BAS29141.1 amidohydrolase [Limnochorda pilosa]